MSKKFALVIANSEYEDDRLTRLVTPDADAGALAEILRDSRIGGFDEVTALVNQPAAAIRRAIAAFFARRGRDDLLFLYFSGHGVRDDRGQLFLAVKDTEASLLSGSAIPASFITEEMDNSRSRRQVLVLDCCHSGAFSRGMKGVTGASVGTATAFEGTGAGRVVLTATDSTQYAWEGDRVIGQAEHSVFTHHLIHGLRSGAADLRADGLVTIDELYDYVYAQVVHETPRQTPGKWSYGQQGEIVIAQNPNLGTGAAAPPASPPPRPAAGRSPGPGAAPAALWKRLPPWAYPLVLVIVLISFTALVLYLNSYRQKEAESARQLTQDASVIAIWTQAAAEAAAGPPATQPAAAGATQKAEPQPTPTLTNTPTQPAAVGLAAQITDERGVTMMLVPEGAFQLGSEMGEPDEKPAKTVFLDAFYIDQTEATNAQYAQCVADGACSPPEDRSSYTHPAYYGSPEFSDFPVIFINWQAAQDYCEWRGGRLPTEAEWEKAGRGADGRTYPWGEGASCALANLYTCAGDVTRAGSYPGSASPYGVLDLSGNVWEWTADWYAEGYYATLAQDARNPTGPEAGSARVIRGGSWADDRYQLRLTERFQFNPLGSDNALGFRCARVP